MEDAMQKMSLAVNVADDMVEDSAPSLTVNPVESKHSGDVHSLEDITWADSCMVNDTERLVPNWVSLLNAFERPLGSHYDFPVYTAPTRNALLGGIEIPVAPTSKEVESPICLTSAFDPAFLSAVEELEKNDDNYPTDDQIDALPLESEYQNVFLPTYNESMRAFDDLDAEFDLLFPVYLVEPRDENIFKEWDIDIPAEEDEFTKQLEKVLTGVYTSQADSSNFDGIGVSDVSRGRSIDDLVAGVVDLSIDDIISGVSDLSLNRKAS